LYYNIRILSAQPPSNLNERENYYINTMYSNYNIMIIAGQGGQAVGGEDKQNSETILKRSQNLSKTVVYKLNRETDSPCGAGRELQ